MAAPKKPAKGGKNPMDESRRHETRKGDMREDRKEQKGKGK